MDQYLTGGVIRRLREEKGLTQAGLAEKLTVSDKTVSKWETGKGYPDITLLEPIAEVFGVSVTELLAGSPVRNSNRAANLLRAKFYVCPVCGNVLQSTGEAVILCHGVRLTPCEPEPADGRHGILVTDSEDEYFVRVEHEMSKTHYISFLAALSDDRVQTVKLYPEGNAEARFKRGRVRRIVCYCNRDGAFYTDVK